MSSAGDVNGDGFDDRLIGAFAGDAAGDAKSYSGESYLIFGGNWTSSLTQGGTTGSDSLTGDSDADVLVAGLGDDTLVYGADVGDPSGITVRGAGDVNGDGFGDLVIAAGGFIPEGSARDATAKTFVVFGGASMPSTIDLANVGSVGFAILPIQQTDQILLVDSAGDMNGDGFDDLVIGNRLGDGAGDARHDSGETYVVFGGANIPAIVDLMDLGSAGMTIYGADAEDQSPLWVSGARDLNADGFDDLVIGSWFADAGGNLKANAGESYVIFGGSTLPATMDLGNLGIAGFMIPGANAGDQSGFSVGGAGDVNGDGFYDLLIGAISANSSAGASYVVYGVTGRNQ